MAPTVSFVVPCYKLAHLLAECVRSILCQTYGDLELLIMDDCSPDDTREVVATFTDPRVRYLHNEQNIGHLRNYNKGITLANGKYIWVISADDRLRCPYLVERYVRLMDANPYIGYACCPAVNLSHGVETTVDGGLVDHDSVFEGKQFLLRYLLNGNCIAAASGMVRRCCYERLGEFPLDLPYAGDWYLWCLFALHYDVAYFAQPMVNYRAHELSMTTFLMSQRATQALTEGFTVLWRIRHEAHRIGARNIVSRCEDRLARLYAMHLIGWTHAGQPYRLSERDFEQSLRDHGGPGCERAIFHANVWRSAGDISLMQRNVGDARRYYARGLRYAPYSMPLRARHLLTHTGGTSVQLGKLIRTVGKHLSLT